MSGSMLLRGKGFDLGPYSTRFDLERRTMLNVLDLQAEQRPDHRWLVFDDADSLTFSAARDAVNRVGNAVASELPDGGHVAIFLRNQVEFMPALLGPMAAGAVTVSLNPELRGPLLADTIERSDAQLLITRADLLERLVALGSLGSVRLIVASGETAGETPARIAGARVVSWSQWVEGRAPERPGERPKGWDLAMIQFTSGTTGRSKGVMYPHQFLYLYSSLVSDSLEREAGDVLSTPLPLCHAAALHIVAGQALHAGATAHLQSAFSVSRYWSELAANGATFSILLGTMAEMILKASDDPPRHRVTEVMCLPFPPSGEAFERRFGVKLLWQGYGMTEIYPHPMPKRMIPDAPHDMVGHAVSWMEYGVVDDHDRPVETGAVGNLVYRPLIPYTMFDGYYRDPAATHEALRNFCFHTGDLACLDEEGRVHYRGRRHDRIRRRGENISASELELVACLHPRVVEAAAYGVPAALGEHDIKLDVVAHGALDAEQFHGWLREQLPSFMVPRYLEQRDTFPRTPSQRIEKYKLAEEGVERVSVLDFEPQR